MGRPFIINDETIYYKLNCDFSIKGKKFSIRQKRPKRVFFYLTWQTANYCNTIIFYLIARFTPYICPIYLLSHCALLPIFVH